MPLTVFIERSRMGRSIYELSDRQLEIWGKRGWNKYSRKLELQNLSFGVLRHRRRDLRAAGLLFALCLILGGVTCVLLLQDKIPLGAVIFLAMGSGAFSVTFLVGAIRWLSPFEIIQFNNHLGAEAFHMVKEDSRGEELEAFVEQLRSAVRQARNAGGPDISLRVGEQKGCKAQLEYRWKLALMFGCLSMGMSILLDRFEIAGVWASFVICSCTIGGVGYAVYSYIRREKYWPLSILGGILSLLPVYFGNWR
jgi:hypothetical protein